MKEEKTPVKSSAGKENEPGLENGKKKGKEEKPATKVVVRRLPPSMTEEQFKNQVAPLPDIDYFCFVPADMSLAPHAFCRTYINFVDQADLFIFTQKFDGYVFVDSKGGEFPAVVEFAPFQHIPKNRPNRKKDPKMGTIELDPGYIAFKERFEAETLENRTAVNASKQHFFETSLVPEKKEVLNTPLLDYVKHRRMERQRIRDEKREEKRKKDLERRRAKDEQRRTKKEDDTSVVKVLNSQNATKERPKEKEIKQGFVKKKPEEVKTTIKERSSTESRIKENKARTGKSYQEERQRQAERREEQRRRLSQSQSSSSVSEAKSPTVAEEKTAASEEKLPEEKASVSETNVKETEYKKPERPFKREEVRRNSYKYEKYDSKRERDSDESRRTRRSINERSTRRDDERSEDSGRKRYSESRRSHETSQRGDRYKEKDKSKGYGQKKPYGSTAEVDKSKNSSANKPPSSIATDEISDKVESEVKTENNELSGNPNKETDSSSNNKETNQEAGASVDLGAKPKTFDLKEKIKPTRRKSLDYENSKSSSSYSSSKVYNREKYSDRKRRNSVGSNKQNRDTSDFSPHLDGKDKSFLLEKSSSKEKTTKEEGLATEQESKLCKNEENPPKDVEVEFEEKDRNVPKRRNSTGDRQDSEKQPIRRNSLGSEDKNQVIHFKELKFDSGVASEESKTKDEKSAERSRRDPRTERRIRNKDRPSIEIYRPGMGRFSKQRLEREKGLGSSTEIDSPSSSPSPTPVLKHKTAPLH